MSEPCPKCGATKQYADMPNGVSVPLGYACGTTLDWETNRTHGQSDKCRIAELEAEVAALRLRLLSAAGDDLCRLSQEEIKAYTSGKVQIPPKEEFISSCERFHAQIANDAGVLKGCLTLAQLIAENAKLEAEIARLKATPCPQCGWYPGVDADVDDAKEKEKWKQAWMRKLESDAARKEQA